MLENTIHTCIYYQYFPNIYHKIQFVSCAEQDETIDMKVSIYRYWEWYSFGLVPIAMVTWRQGGANQEHEKLGDEVGQKVIATYSRISGSLYISMVFKYASSYGYIYVCTLCVACSQDGPFT